MNPQKIHIGKKIIFKINFFFYQQMLQSAKFGDIFFFLTLKNCTIEQHN